MSTIDRTPHNSDWSYEETVAQLENLIAQVESGEIPLEEVFSKFAIAVEYAQQCEAFLSQGRERMNLLIEMLTEEPDF